MSPKAAKLPASTVARIIRHTRDRKTSPKKLMRHGRLTTASAENFRTMIKVKPKSQPQPEAPKASLAERIKETCAAAEEYIQEEVRRLKASPEGQSLPIGWLEGDLRRRTGGHCNCKCVLALQAALDKES